jgi:hypothetical protein
MRKCAACEHHLSPLKTDCINRATAQPEQAGHHVLDFRSFLLVRSGMAVTVVVVLIEIQ